MAGTLTITDQKHRSFRKLTLAWVSDASGDVNGTLTAILSGLLNRVGFVPDSGGTQPTDLYDVTLEDADTVDVLDGAGMQQSNLNTASILSGELAIDGTLELKVSNAGNAKGGTVVLYVR